MPRSRRAWSVLRDSEIRVLLRETTAATSFWTDAQLLILFNSALDRRVMQLATLDEGWVTDQWTTSLVANQREYPLPEGAGRIKRVSLKWTEGNRTYEVPLERNEYWQDGVVHVTGTPGSINSYRPTFQLQGNLLILEPAPGFTLAASLMIDLESAPARISVDADKIDLRFPDVMETLLVYDTVVLALAMEHSMGNLPEDYVNQLKEFRDSMEGIFLDYCSDRTEGMVRGRPFRLGA